MSKSIREMETGLITFKRPNVPQVLFDNQLGVQVCLQEHNVGGTPLQIAAGDLDRCNPAAIPATYFMNGHFLYPVLT